jgi:hypothetical protein
MNFGTTTRVIIQDQRVKAIEPKLKTMIVAAAQNAVANHQFIIGDGDFAGGTGTTYFEDDLPEAPCYVAVRGKGAGKKDAVLLYQTKKVQTEKSAYEYQEEFAERLSEELVKTITAPGGVPVTAAVDGIDINEYALLTPLYEYYRGSPLRITNDATDSRLVGLTNEAKAAASGLLNIVAMYHDADDDTILSATFTLNGSGEFVLEGEALESDHVMLLEDAFNIGGTGVAHGTLYINYVYNDASLADTMYYIEDLDGLRNVFNNDALTIGPSGAAYNAHKYMLANGSSDGFYLYAVAPAAGSMYLTAEEIAAALLDTYRYKDAYDVVPVTHDPDMPALMDAHLLAMAEPDKRMERRGYVGLYMPEGTVHNQYDEFEHLCEIGPENERDYMIGVTEESGGTGRFGSRAAYVSAMMNLNAYTTNAKLTLCHTKYGILDGQYVTAGTLMAIYVGYRRTFLPGYVLAETPLPFISSVSFAGMLSDIDHLHALQNYGILSIYQATPGAPVTIYYPCTAATDYIQKSEEYLVTGTDLFAREIRASLEPHIARGEDNKTSPGFTGQKAVDYKKKMQTFFSALKTRYVENYGLFDDARLISIPNNPDYEGGIMIAVRVVYKYAVNHIEVILYI